MDELRTKLEELLKGLFSLKEQQGPFVPAIKTPSFNTKIKPPSSGIKVNSPPAAPKVAGGLPPTSKKDPAKVAEQLKNPRPQKVQTEVLKFEDNGQWSLIKSDGVVLPATTKVGGKGFTLPSPPSPSAPALSSTPPKTTNINGKGFELPSTAQPAKIGASTYTAKPSADFDRDDDETIVTKHPGPKQPSSSIADDRDAEDAAVEREYAREISRKKSMNGAPVSSEDHGWKTHSPEQDALIDGLDISSRKYLRTDDGNIDVANRDKAQDNLGLQGASWATSAKHPHRVLLKRALDHHAKDDRGHMFKMPDGSTFNSARREVLYHDLANKFFGMGKHVPTTSGFTYEGEDWSGMKEAKDASVPELATVGSGSNEREGLANGNHERILSRLHNSGELDKLTMMDFLMGHHDRHRNNLMMDNKGSGLHLVDNGTAFDYGNFDDHAFVPAYRYLARKIGANKLRGGEGHDANAGFHPEAVKWLNELDPEKAVALMREHGHDNKSPAIKGLRARFDYLKDAIAKNDGASPFSVFEQGRVATHQQPEEYT